MHPVAAHDLTSALVKFYSRDGATGNRESLLQFFKQFSAWCAERHIDILLVYTPGVVELTFDPIDRAGRSGGVVVDRNAPYEAISSAATGLGIPLLDLRPALARESLSQQSLTLLDKAHYSAPVCAALASDIWEALSSGELAAQYAAPSQSKSETDHH